MPTVKPPAEIGPYRVLDVLGEGGVGTVYLAEQEAPIRRRVAVKLIKLGMETREVLARFELERQALAMMDHPNIARIFDAGETRSGRPYFVMEYVDGLPITEHCDTSRLEIRDRLALFAIACRAVQHAHQRGIIHRDIKPTNVLVREQDGEAVPVVIDFGLAKAVEESPDKTLLTRQGQLLGTPQYMSPEQIELAPQELDTRTDVYSLGVLLYELVVGVPPFERSVEEGLPNFVQRMREEESPRPSTRFSRLSARAESIAGNRQTNPVALVKTLRGDLERIMSKALEKDRDERYATAAELGGDVERYLRDEPILAAAPTAAYRLQRFVRRHRWSVAVFGALFLAWLVASAASAFWYLRASERREDKATIIRICDSIQLRIADAHLWFEEAVARDESIRLERDVHPPIRESIELIGTMLSGGETAEFGPLQPVDVEAARAELVLLRDELERLEEITRERWRERDEAGRAGGSLDQDYDAVYRSILSRAVSVSGSMEAAMVADWRRSTQLGIAVNLLAVVLLATPALVGLRLAAGRRSTR